MITTSIDNYLTDEILERYDQSTTDIKRETLMRFAARAVAYSQMLEQHDRYDLGCGWSLVKRSGEWFIYYKGKHVDAWENPSVQEDKLTSYRSVVIAMDAASNLAANAEWSR